MLFGKTNSKGYQFKYQKGLFYLVNPKGKIVKYSRFHSQVSLAKDLPLVEKNLSVDTS